MKYLLKYTVMFETVIDCDDPENFDDLVSNIDIPENETNGYFPNSFETHGVKLIKRTDEQYHPL